MKIEGIDNISNEDFAVVIESYINDYCNDDVINVEELEENLFKINDNFIAVFDEKTGDDLIKEYEETEIEDILYNIPRRLREYFDILSYLEDNPVEFEECLVNEFSRYHLYNSKYLGVINEQYNIYKLY